MIKIGITGGIGSGKTTVARLFLSLGFPVYEADVEAKKLINHNTRVKEQIIELLGEKAYNAEGYNRAYVGSVVFNDKLILNQLNSIVHPAVANHFEQWCDEHNDHNIVFQEAAILFENGSYTKFDKTILVTAPQHVRLQRVMRRDGLSEQKVIERMNNQWTDEAKVKLADFVIDCDGQNLVIPQVLNVLKSL
ncbi:dephospho-CoA kinase [Carboxylicivirga mesophila]|uniref:Dephospho-CoA kinase n=1 Tax=Carboxylicivirga mesophila TaxID=1166478 RepID=A0ABS5KHB4_9BACT|nr:dephospho-CoA kinase [Carboxylicivirga mesophila]MBS2213758.1 dephospho-CoA kinase [Carboxylicivirga mesophila]